MYVSFTLKIMHSRKRGAGQIPPCTLTQGAPAPRESATQIFASLRRARRPSAENTQAPSHADPRTATLHARAKLRPKRLFLLHRARRVLFWGKTERGPAAPRTVGRGGAGERAQFSPQAETELSGLCDDDNGGRIPRGSGPCGSRISRGRRSAAQPVSVESLPQRFPAGPARAGGGLPRGGNQPLRDAGTRRLGYSALRGASKIFVKNSALDGNFSPLPCVSTGKRSRCSPESIGKDERE